MSIAQNELEAIRKRTDTANCDVVAICHGEGVKMPFTFGNHVLIALFTIAIGFVTLANAKKERIAILGACVLGFGVFILIMAPAPWWP